MTPVDQVAALRAPSTTPHPDARLLAICERLAVIFDELDELWRHKRPGYVARSNELTSEREPLMRELAQRPARTAAGRQAKGEIASRGMMGGAVWTDLARSALQDYRNAGQASEGGQ
jgi:hypothetical protein